jgi:EAL domain-containing protein (putative c-di-GMP-specific phosphodiesterase class I)/GGDEF domain-containing protein
MARKNTLRLLLVNASDNDSERLISLFRAAGRVARAHRLTDAGDLDSKLGNAPKPLDNWDLLIADDNNPLLSVDECLAFLTRKKLPLPTIVVRADADLPALLAAGAHDVIPAGDEQRLMFSALRALDTTDLRRRVLALTTQLKEAEQRNTLLLGDAAEAIAYIADGMVINANALFAKCFGYADAGDLDCVPIVDLIAADDQDKFKAGLKAGDGAEFGCRGITAAGEIFAAQLKLGSAAYEGEPCLQIALQMQSADTQTPASADGDAESGLFTLAHLRRQQTGSGTLALVAIDQYEALREEHGYCASRQFAAELGHFVGTHHPFAPHSLSARVGDNCFALLVPETRAERLLEAAQTFALKLAKQHFSCGDADLHGTVSIGLTDVQPDEFDAALDRSWRAVEALRTDSAKPGIGNGARVEAVQRPRVADASVDQEELLQEALDDRRFLLLYQPVISLRGAGGEHYEVLLRLNGGNPDNPADIALPDNFIDSLGRSTANAKLDRWVLLEATKQLADSRARGNDTRLLINLTGNALLDESLPPWLGVALKAAGIPADKLILQVREADVANDPATAKTFIEAIRQLGCRISFSSFGHSLDPLKTLKSIGADFVQLDASFTRDLQNGGGMQGLRELVSQISASNVRVVIPFVENASVLASLWQAGADFIQGHYLQPPSREMNYEFADIA